MATDTMFGEVRQFEDFLITAVGDKAELDINTVTSGSTAITADADGRLRLDVATSDDDDRAAVSFNLNWIAGETDLYMEARCFLSNITDNKFFVGFGDTLAGADETIFSADSDTVVIDTMADAIGILFDNNATTKVFWAVAGNTDSVTVDQDLPSRLNPVATEAFTLGVKLSLDRKSAEFYVNGETAHRVDSDSALVAAGALCPMVVNFEQGTGNNLDVDYLYARKPRSTS